MVGGSNDRHLVEEGIDNLWRISLRAGFIGVEPLQLLVAKDETQHPLPIVA